MRKRNWEKERETEKMEGQLRKRSWERRKQISVGEQGWWRERGTEKVKERERDLERGRESRMKVVKRDKMRK